MVNFFRIDRAIAALALAPALACAQGRLELPEVSSFQSGIGQISGWHCNAQRIEISIDLGPPILVSSHTPREDTAAICGRSDTGFAMDFQPEYSEARGEASGVTSCPATSTESLRLPTAFRLAMSVSLP